MIIVIVIILYLFQVRKLISDLEGVHTGAWFAIECRREALRIYQDVLHHQWRWKHFALVNSLHVLQSGRFFAEFCKRIEV